VALDGISHRIKKSKDETAGDQTGPRLGYSNPSDNPYVGFRRVSPVAFIPAKVP
jgi:hypothetical protein